jgi:hypothetical protein
VNQRGLQDAAENKRDQASGDRNAGVSEWRCTGRKRSSLRRKRVQAGQEPGERDDGNFRQRSDHGKVYKIVADDREGV